jgi:trehalose-6-phosphate synthase
MQGRLWTAERRQLTKIKEQLGQSIINTTFNVLHSYGEDKEKEEDDDRKTKSQYNSKRVSLYYSSSRSQWSRTSNRVLQKGFWGQRAQPRIHAWG